MLHWFCSTFTQLPLLYGSKNSLFFIYFDAINLEQMDIQPACEKHWHSIFQRLFLRTVIAWSISRNIGQFNKKNVCEW